MINEETRRKLRELNIGEFVSGLELKQTDPATIALTFDERMQRLTDYVYQEKYNGRIQRLIKGAKFRFPQADMHSLYYEGRGLNRELLNSLFNCQYVTAHQSIILQGFTGSGKTYLACALGKQACLCQIKTRYIRLPDLLMEYGDAVIMAGQQKRLLTKYGNIPLLISSPRGERPSFSKFVFEHTKFQSMLPRGERLFLCKFTPHNRTISIHAPTRGATHNLSVQQRRSSFQSTLPRGERLGQGDFQWGDRNFNPRPHAGSDKLRDGTQTGGGLFQSTPPRGERQYPTYKFSVRTISIHAPRVGSDNGRDINNKQILISIHAPRVGSDQLNHRGEPYRAISIHAPRVGSDPCIPPQKQKGSDFNPRSPRGERPYYKYDGLRVDNFNPLSRVGSDSIRCCAVTLYRHFNPRSPRGERR